MNYVIRTDKWKIESICKWPRTCKEKERKEKKPEGREADLGRQRQVGMAAVIEIV